MVEIGLGRVCVFSTCYARIRQSSLSFLSRSASEIYSPKSQICPPSFGMATAAWADRGAGAFGLVYNLHSF